MVATLNEINKNIKYIFFITYIQVGRVESDSFLLFIAEILIHDRIKKQDICGGE